MALMAGVVPITIQAHDFALRAVADDVGVGMRSDLPFRYKARTSAGMAPPSNALYDDDVAFAWIISTTSTPKSGTAPAGRARFVQGHPGSHGRFSCRKEDTVLRAVSAKSQHAVDVMTIVGGE